MGADGKRTVSEIMVNTTVGYRGHTVNLENRHNKRGQKLSTHLQLKFFFFPFYLLTQKSKLREKLTGFKEKHCKITFE